MFMAAASEVHCVSASALARVHSCFNLNDFGIVISVLNFTYFVSESSAEYEVCCLLIKYEAAYNWAA